MPRFYRSSLVLSAFLVSLIFFAGSKTASASTCGSLIEPCDPINIGQSVILSDFQKEICNSDVNKCQALTDCLIKVKESKQGSTNECLKALENSAAQDTTPAKNAVYDSKIPEFNPLCWTADQCYAVRAQFLNKLPSDLTEQEKAGWVKDQTTCPGENFGKCLPAGVSQTQISFGGKNRFLNIGDFISQMYRLAVGVASVLAVVMIIVAGFQWVTSGGNSESIQSAKHRISGAIIGLIIAFLSYAILNTISPTLVSLRLPQVWMLKPQSLVPQFCSSAPGASAFAYTGKGTDDQVSQITPPSTLSYDLTLNGKPKAPLINPNLNVKWKEDTFFCGKRFFVKDGGSAACYGDYCGPGRVCTSMNYKGKPPTQKYTCFPGMLIGTVYGTTLSAGLTISLSQLAKSGEAMKLMVLCKGGALHEITEKDTIQSDGGEVRYAFAPQENLDGVCGAKDDILGFYLGVTVHETLGSDDWFAIGQSAPGSRLCDTNLAGKVFHNIYGQNPSCTTVECTCSFLSVPEVRATLASKLHADSKSLDDITNHLISLDELKRGYECNVSLDRSNFPAADNHVIKRVIYGAGTGVAIGAAAALTAGAVLPVATWIVAPNVLVGGATFAGAFSGMGIFSDPTSCDAGGITSIGADAQPTNSFLGK